MQILVTVLFAVFMIAINIFLLNLMASRRRHSWTGPARS
jgi:hypothetical protein